MHDIACIFNEESARMQGLFEDVSGFVVSENVFNKNIF